MDDEQWKEVTTFEDAAVGRRRFVSYTGREQIVGCRHERMAPVTSTQPQECPDCGIGFSIEHRPS